MSGAPFRDLFVELPAAVFEALQAIGEAAVTQASAAAPRPPRPVSGWLSPGIAVRLAARYGLAEIDLARDPWRVEIVVTGRRRCGHRIRGQFSERALLIGDPTAALDAIDAAVDQAERTCCCMEPLQR